MYERAARSDTRAMTSGSAISSSSTSTRIATAVPAREKGIARVRSTGG
jgi:hypothetical protein